MKTEASKLANPAKTESSKVAENIKDRKDQAFESAKDSLNAQKRQENANIIV